MGLIDYIKQQGGTGTMTCPVLLSLANRANCSHRTLYMVARGHKEAGPKLARRLSAHTGISLEVLRPDYFGEVSKNDLSGG